MNIYLIENDNQKVANQFLEFTAKNPEQIRDSMTYTSSEFVALELLGLSFNDIVVINRKQNREDAHSFLKKIEANIKDAQIYIYDGDVITGKDIRKIVNRSPHYVILIPSPHDPIQNMEDENIMYSSKIKTVIYSSPDIMSIISGQETYHLFVSDIAYIESDRRKIIIHGSDGMIYSTYAKLGDVEEQYMGRYLRSHQSYLVSMKFIEKMNNKEISLTTGDTIPISQKRRTYCKDTFTRYKLEQLVTQIEKEPNSSQKGM